VTRMALNLKAPSVRANLRHNYWREDDKKKSGSTIEILCGALHGSTSGGSGTGMHACQLLTLSRGRKTKRERLFPTFWDHRTLSNRTHTMMETR